jgi:endo-1,4-beta-xylanase
MNLYRAVFTLLLASMLSLSFNSLAALPDAIDLLPNGFASLTPYGGPEPQSRVKEVDVKGQSFDKAWQISTFGKSPEKGEAGIIGKIDVPLKKGDVLWMSFKVRKLDSKRESGEGSFEARFDNLVNGKYSWPTHVERGISFGSEWTEFSIPFYLEKDVPVGAARFIIKFDTYEQSFELSPVALKSYGSQVKVSDLPKTTVTYSGGEPKAPWRKEAAERIEKYRKGDLNIQVLDANGNAIKDAEVEVRMTRNSFQWGTAVTSKSLLDKTEMGEKYREVVKKYFNHIVYENEMKPKNWARQKPEDYGVQTKLANQWLRDNGITARGHVFVWPSFKHSPQLVDIKNDPEAIKAAIRKSIDVQAKTMLGEFTEWDVMNEYVYHNEIVKMLGNDEMFHWFKAAREGAPGVKLFYNDFTMFHGKGEGSNSQKFYDIVKLLKDNGAPLDAIGEQSHIGGTPPAITDLIERLDYFSKLGLPIQITEFDIASSDDEFKARYLSDFMTVMYSHPNVIGFVQWGFYAPQHWFPASALWNADWSIRQHGQAYIDLVTKTWWTNADLKTNAKGSSNVRGFTGEYEITVKHKGKTNKVKAKLDNKGTTVKVEI